MITFGSLFAGIGGWDLGLERAGWECKWQVEIDDYCNKVLEKHWPDVPRYRDVYGVSASSLETVDAICGGFPCQPFSLVGRREGTSDERWLWPEFARLVGEMGPKYVFVENVPGIYTQGGVEIAADLATFGYGFEWGVIPARATGAPHRRERFFLVAYSGSSGRQQIPESSHGYEGKNAGGGKEDNYVSSGHGEGYRDGRVPGVMAQISKQVWREWEPDPANDVESGVGRVAYGLPDGVDRNRVLGNAMIPHIAETIGRVVNEVG